MLDLARYLDRIDWDGPLAPDLPTLTALMRAHTAAIPFEALDVQLGKPPGVEVGAAFTKLVERRRGGWCYEQNGLFGWALGQIGFAVMRVAGGVMRQERGDSMLGNHLTLIVRLERDYLVDVGFGGGVLLAPLPLEEGERHDAPFTVSLTRVADGYWRYGERTDGPAFTFDFRAEPADEAFLAARFRTVGTHPESVFVQTLTVQRRIGDRVLALRGRTLTETRPDRVSTSLVADSDALVAIMRKTFGLDVPEVAALWPKVAARHEAMLAAQPPVVPTT